MNTFNLTEQYRLLNRQIFNNLLPHNIPVKWNISKTAMGKTRIKHNYDGTFVFAITVSRFFICTDKEYTETLIHEMIHVYMAVRGEFRKDKLVHGPIFQAHMNRINRDFPQYRITVKEKRQLPIDSSRIALQHGFFLALRNKSYFNLNFREIEITQHRKIIKTLTRSYGIHEGEIYFFRGKYPELATAPVRRNFKTLTGKIQFLHDIKVMDSLHQGIRNNHISHYSIKNKRSFIGKIFL